MRGDGILQTHNGTGGTGTLTLAAVTGWPSFALVFAQDRFVDYEINEYTDATWSVLSKRETGIGTYTHSGTTLARTFVINTWDGSTYLPVAGSGTAPTAISFGNTAANVRIVCSPSSGNAVTTPAMVSQGVSGVSDALGFAPLNLLPSSTSLTTAMSLGYSIYSPIYLANRGPISQATSRLVTPNTTGATPSKLYVAIYEVNSSGMPGKRLIDFNGTGGGPVVTDLSAAAGNYSSSALTTPIYLPPGWYYQGVVAVANNGTGGPSIRGCWASMAGPLGTTLANATPLNGYAFIGPSQTALNDPATAPTALNSGQTPALILFK
jgi:hypothetical protein